MLALVVAVALGQCTKDVDCKGQRVCSAGECVEAGPRAGNALRLIEVDRLRRELSALRAELADTTVVGAVVKLVMGGVLVGCGAGFDALSQTNRDAILFYVSVAAFALGAVLAIWGGIELPFRIGDRARLDERIREHEAQLGALGEEP